jgi:hypothetical protein
LARRDEATCGAARRVFISGQKRGVFGVIKRELRRRSAIEAVIGHMKTDGHLGRCYLKGRAGDAANAVLDRSRLQLAPHPRLAEGLVVPHPDSAHTSFHDPVSAQISLLTDDYPKFIMKSRCRLRA